MKKVTLLVPDGTSVLIENVIYMNDDYQPMVTNSILTNGDRRLSIGNGEPLYVPDIYDPNRGKDNDM